MIFSNRWSKPAYWFNIYSWRKTLLMSRLLKPCPLTSQSVQEPMALNLFITSIHNIPYVYVCKRMQPIWLKYIHCYLVYYIVHSWIAQIKFYMFSMIFQSPFWFPVTDEFPAQRPVTRSFHVFFDLRLDGRLSKQSWGWWFETPSRPLWRHSNV